MRPHPDPNLGAGRPVECGQRELSADGGRDGAAGTVEGNEEPVPGGVDLVPAVGRERVPQKSTVVAPDRGEDAVTDAPNELGRSLDVAEEEGHSAARQQGPAHRSHLRISLVPSVRANPAVLRARVDRC